MIIDSFLNFLVWLNELIFCIKYSLYSHSKDLILLMVLVVCNKITLNCFIISFLLLNVLIFCITYTQYSYVKDLILLMVLMFTNKMIINLFLFCHIFLNASIFFIKPTQYTHIKSLILFMVLVFCDESTIYWFILCLIILKILITPNITNEIPEVIVQPISEEKKPEDFQSNVDQLEGFISQQFPSYLVRREDFKILYPKDGRSKKLMSRSIFENQNSKEHMFNFLIKFDVKTSDCSILFEDLTAKDIIKEFGVFQVDEIQYQVPLFGSLIRQMLMYNPYYEKNLITFNTIEDIKRSIIQVAGDEVNLEIVLKSTPFNSEDNNYMSYYLKSNESCLGDLNIYFEKEEDQLSLSDKHLLENYSLKFGFNIAKDNKLSSEWLEVPVFDINSKNFEAEIQKFSSAIDFENNFNNLDQLCSLLEDFFKQNSKNIVIKVIEQSEIERTYEISLENSNISLYVGSALTQETTDYSIMMDYVENNFKSPFVNCTFKRNSKNDLYKMLSIVEVRKILMSHYEDIMFMFNENYKSQRLVITSELKMPDYGDLKPFVESNLMGKNAKGKRNKDILCPYLEEDNKKRKKITLSLKSTSQNMEYRETFFKDRYNRKLVKQTIDLFFAKYLEYFTNM